MICLMALLVTSAQAQCPGNLITNGDFETGAIAPATTDFSWEVYDQGIPDELWDEGDYTVGPNPRDVHPAWAIMTDHSGSGNMLIVNAGITPAMRVWEQAVAVVSGTQYTLTYWLSSTYPANPASIQCSIEGDVSGTTTFGPQAAPGPGIWIEVSYTWTAGASDALATITLEDMTYEADGDDFAIDDICFVATLITVAIDIKPGSCPNPFNVKSKGSVPVGILGTADFDATTVDPTTVVLTGPGGSASALEETEEKDSSEPDGDPTDCYNCFDADDPANFNCDLDLILGDDAYCGDGELDLIVKFDTQELAAAIGPTIKGGCVELTLTGQTLAGASIEGSDSVLVIKTIQAP